MIRQWVRTCQECGGQQNAKKPDTNRELTNAYANAKCRRCGSRSLDYGTVSSDDEWADE